jgi:hypothetical protein
VTSDDDIGKCILDADAMAELEPLQKKAKAPAARAPRAEFVQLPYKQILTAAGKLKTPVLVVLIELEHQRFKTHENPVALTNAVLRSAGLTRWTKNQALRRLERAGLITVLWRGQKAPLVTLLW